jgi:hypothetical protein
MKSLLWFSSGLDEEHEELPFDEAGQAISIATVRDLPEERLQVLADDTGGHGVFGVAGLRHAVGMGTPWDSACAE